MFATYFVLFCQGTIPVTIASPESGHNNPDIILIAVDFPAPFGPISPTISPSAMSSVIPFSASFSVNFFVNSDLSASINPCPRLNILKVFFRSFTWIIMVAPLFCSYFRLGT